MDMKEKLQSMLKPKRYRHSLGVAESAVELAKRHGVDENKAYTAGLLHDAAKNLSDDEMIGACRDYGIEPNAVELNTPSLLHGAVAAELIKVEFGVFDQEISEAIRVHTVGKADMSDLDKIIYIADMIEPSRSFDGVERLRKLAPVDLDRAMAESLRQTLEYNLRKGTPIHPASVDAWNSLLLGNPKLLK